MLSSYGDCPTKIVVEQKRPKDNAHTLNPFIFPPRHKTRSESDSRRYKGSVRGRSKSPQSKAIGVTSGLHSSSALPGRLGDRACFQALLECFQAYLDGTSIQI